MAARKSSRVNRKYKAKYRVRNWREYERGLTKRGDVTIWLSEENGADQIFPALLSRDRKSPSRGIDVSGPLTSGSKKFKI